MKTCCVEGCNNKHYAKGYCSKHYNHFRRHGKILNKHRRLPNEIILYDDHAEIILCDNKGEEIGRTKIDLEDVDKVKDYKWSITGNSYIRNNKTGIRLHRFVMNCPDDKIVDHINHDRFDNRKSNLRICNNSQNQMNTSLRKDNKSGYKGITWNKRKNKWMVRIGYKDSSIFLGYFDNLEEAIEIRKEAEKKYHKEYTNK